MSVEHYTVALGIRPGEFHSRSEVSRIIDQYTVNIYMINTFLFNSRVNKISNTIIERRQFSVKVNQTYGNKNPAPSPKTSFTTKTY